MIGYTDILSQSKITLAGGIDCLRYRLNKRNLTIGKKKSRDRYLRYTGWSETKKSSEEMEIMHIWTHKGFS